MYIVFGSLFVLGCGKDEPVCESLPSGPSWGYNYINTGIHNMRPSFNPNNSIEFVFYQVNYTNSTKGIYTYNLHTNEKKLVIEADVIFNPKWSTTGQILLNQPDGNLYAIRPDGSGLRQLTFCGTNFYGEWLPQGDKILYESQCNSTFTTYIIDTLGTVLDSIPNTNISPFQIWYDEYHVITTSYNSILSLDLSTKEFSTIYQSSNPDILISNIALINDDLIFWSNDDGIFLTNISNGSTTIIRASCDSHFYVNPTYSLLLNKVVLQKVTSTVDLLNKYTSRELVIVNYDGTDETLIAIY